MWYNRFKEGREDVNDDARLGCPRTSTTDDNIEAVKKMILDNCRITLRKVADGANIIYVLVMKCAAVKIVPKLLNFEQKQHCMDIAQKMLTAFIVDPDLLKKVITGDESWV